MAGEWPQFSTLQPLDGVNGWTAVFHREHSGGAYYLVRTFDQERQVQTGELIADVKRRPREELSEELERIAGTGVSNTNYVATDDDWIPTTLETYRAERPFAVDAVMHTERLDWATRIAYEACEDRKHLVSYAALLAKDFRPWYARVLSKFWPWPSRLEAVDRWSSTTAFDQIDDASRAWFFGLLLATLILLIGDFFVWNDALAQNQRKGLIGLAFPLLTYVFRRVARRVFAIGLRRKLATLDEPTALETVVEAMRGAEQTPYDYIFKLANMRSYMNTRTGNKRLMIEYFWVGGKMSEGRLFLSTFLAHDATRGVRYYRVSIFKRKRKLGELVAEIQTDDLPELASHHARKEVDARVQAVAETGQSNTTYRRWKPPPRHAPVPLEPTPSAPIVIPRRGVIRELQRLLMTMKRNDIGGGYDLWDKQGAQHSTPEERARLEAEAQEIFRQYDRARDALVALIAASDVEDVRAWARAHVEYLTEVLADLAKDPEKNKYSIESGTDTLAEWQKVLAGELPYSTRYQLVDEVPYRTYFGIDPMTLEDVEP